MSQVGVEFGPLCQNITQVDPDADQLLDAAMAGDKSNEWFAKKGRVKVEEA